MYETYRPQNTECLELAGAKLKSALDIARQIASIKLTPSHSPKEINVIRQFRLFLKFEAWNTGAILVLYNHLLEIDPRKAESYYQYMILFRAMLSRFFFQDGKDEVSKLQRAQLAASWNHLRASYRAACRTKISVSILKHFIRNLETMLDQIVSQGEFISDFSSGERQIELTEMVEHVKTARAIDEATEREGKDDVTTAQLRNLFLGHVEEYIMPRMHLGGEVMDALLIRIEKSIEMSQQYERSSMVVKQLYEYTSVLESIRNNISRMVSRAAQKITEVYNNVSIWEPVKTAFKILGWLVVAPVLGICDAVSATTRLKEYNDSITKTWNEGKVGVVLALLGVLGCGGFIGVAAAVAYGAIVPMFGLGVHLGSGLLCLTTGFAAGGYTGYQYRESQILQIQQQHEHQLVRSRADENNAQIQLAETCRTLNANPEYRSLTYDSEIFEQMHEEANAYREFRKQRNQKNAGADAAFSNEYEGILHPTSTEEVVKQLAKVNTVFKDSLDGVIADLCTEEAEEIMQKMTMKISELRQQQQIQDLENNLELQEDKEVEFKRLLESYFGPLN